MIAKLYYGNGHCSIEGTDIHCILIRFQGAIEIDDKTPYPFAITAGENWLVVFPIPKRGDWTGLNDLFDYVGEFKITSVEVSDINANKVPTSIHRVMDYTELLNTNVEDMTTNSEDLSSTHVSGKRVPKTILKQPHINDLHTSDDNNREVYLKNGKRYEGYYHIHLVDIKNMTGKEHTEDSQDLYHKDGRPIKIVKNKRRKIHPRVKTKRNRRGY